MSLSTPPLFLAELTAYDRVSGTTRVIRVANGNGFTTSPSETPADTFYAPCIKQAIDVSRTMFSGGNTSGRSTTPVGDLVLNNLDGALDDLRDVVLSGRDVTLWRTTVHHPSYPGDFVAFSGTMGVPRFSSTEVRIPLRDWQQALANTPLQTTTYAGDNVLPDGLEGVAEDLKGKPKPVLLGGPVRNISPPCVNTPKQIYQIQEGAVEAITPVSDRGDALNRGDGSFTTPASAIAGRVNGLCYGNGLFVAVGDAGVLATSPDGVTWTSRTSGFGASNIQHVAYDAVLGFVAVGAGGKISTSTNGTSWTAQTSGVATYLWGASFFAGLLLVCGDTDTLLTSPTGVTWTARTSGLGGNLTTVIGGDARAIVGGANGFSMTENGTTWTVATSLTPPFSGGTCSAFTGTRFVLPDSNRRIAVSLDPTGAVLLRTDTTSFAGGSISAVTVNGTLILAAGYDGGLAPTIAWSADDGLTWSARALSGSFVLYAAAYGNGMFLVGDANGQVQLSTGLDAYANATDLEDDDLEPAPASVKEYLAGGYVRLGSAATTLTVDATQGATSADRTAGQLFVAVLERAGMTVGDWDAGDITALDIATSAELGFWAGPDDPNVTCADAIDAIARSVGAAWWVDTSGVFRIARLEAPSGTPVLTLTATDLKRPLEILPTADPNDGIPPYRVTVRWGRNYTVLTTDLATGVGDADRAAFAHEWREATAEDLNILTAYPLSTPLVIESLFTTEADAQDEADRVLALRAVQRDRHEVVVELNDETNALDINQVIELVYPRFGLSVVGGESGALMRILDVRPSAAAGELGLTLWGTATGDRNLVTASGAYLVDSAGRYLLAVAA